MPAPEGGKYIQISTLLQLPRKAISAYLQFILRRQEKTIICGIAKIAPQGE
jgi:hypothetical protein